MKYPHEANKKKKSTYYFFALLPFLGIFFMIPIAMSGFFDSNSLLAIIFTFVMGGILVQIFLGKRWNIKED